ncbi:hypothetical protein ACFXAZ_36680 [Streptomyces sp. NPDC059477]|uniref:hypothetical protein n=1 Tax=Streptomyces sp. NPDC059477 TaxID=3346847 RepID=UPI0036C79564
MPFDLGATVRLTADCLDPDGTLITAASAAVTVTLPDGTTAAPAAAETTVPGRYRADYVTAVPGRHTVRWIWDEPAHAYTDVFDVQEAAPPAILSLADAKAHLNIPADSHGDDGEVRFWNAATTRAVEYFTGPIVPRTITEDHPGRAAPVVVLRYTPVLDLVAVQAVRDGSTAYDVDTLDVNPTTGEVTLPGGGVLRGPLRFTYRAGRTVVAENISAGARIILQHLWLTQRAGRRGGLPGGGQDYSVSEPIPGLGYAIPNRALNLLEPDRLPPGVE